MKKITLREYASLPETVFLGTADSYGVEQLVVRRGTGWEDMQIIATFETPEGKSVDVVLADESEAEVPPEATAGRDGKGKITFVGYRDGERRIAASVTTILYGHGPCSADADKAPTPDLVQQILAAAEEAKQAAKAAAEAAAKAGPYAEKAKAAQEAAEQARDDAADARQEAEAAAEAAENSRAAAETLEETARRAALAAEHAKAAAVAAANSAGEDAAAAQQAAEQAANAQSAAEEAQSRAESAQKAAEDAKEAAVAAQGKAEQAAGKATAAQKKAEDAAAKAETLAKRAETAASTATAAARTASAAATNAGNSADAAAQSKAAAETAAKAAQEAQTAAAAAKADSVKAQTAAQAAAKKAQDAQSAAEKARDDAQTARQGAEDARDAAAGSAEAAAKSEANAKQSADTLAESVENVAANTAAVAELKEKKAEIDDSAVGADAWSSKHIVDMLCPKIEESGNPVQCYPVAGYPLGVKASWGPVQEGSGEPYPAGGGKNLWGNLLDKVFVGTTGNLNTISTAKSTAKIACTEKDVYTLSNSNRFASPPSNVGIIAYFDNSDNMLARESVVNNNVLTLIAPAGTAYVRASCYAPTDDDKIQFEKGATATSWGPYENIRPIKGRDSVTVERCGANLLKIDQFATKTRDGVTFEYVSDGGVRIQGTATAIVDSPTFSVWHLPPGKYFGLDMGVGIDASIVVERAGKRLWLNTKGTFEIMPGDITKYWYMIVNTGYVANATIYPCIVPGTTAPTTYTPYIGQTNTLTLPETIYGGSVDAVSGEGAGTWKLLTLDGTEAWDAVGSGDTLYFRSTLISIGTRSLSSGDYCTTFPIASISGSNTAQGINGWGKSLYLRWSTFADVDALKSYLAAQYAAGTPVQVCYKLATPVPFTATGGAELPALDGANTVITDANSVDVTGRADPIKRIADLEAAVASIE